MIQKILFFLSLAIVNSTTLLGQKTSCYLDNLESEKGIVGYLNGIKLFYSVWNIDEPANTPLAQD